jgi:hypothetical protein
MLIDERAHFDRSASSSVAKNTEAAFNISFARRNSEFSLRNRLISSRSYSSGDPGRKPPSASAWRTRLRNVSGDPQILRDMRDRPPRLQREPNTALQQLIWVLLRSCHPRGLSSREDRILDSEPSAKSTGSVTGFRRGLALWVAGLVVWP